MHFEYLGILVALLIIGFGMKAYYKVNLFSNLKQALIFYSIVYVISIIWDNFAIWRGHWFYPGKGILGIFIGLAPLEDYLFVFVTANFALTLYKILQKK